MGKIMLAFEGAKGMLGYLLTLTVVNRITFNPWGVGFNHFGILTAIDKPSVCFALGALVPVFSLYMLQSSVFGMAYTFTEDHIC